MSLEQALINSGNASNTNDAKELGTYIFVKAK
jgi:hypothetical protein